MEGQLKSMRLELDGQMNAVAKLTSTKSVLEKQLEVAYKEISDVNARCSNLREMNKEMLGMLEGKESS